MIDARNESLPSMAQLRREERSRMGIRFVVNDPALRTWAAERYLHRKEVQRFRRQELASYAGFAIFAASLLFFV